MTPSTTNLTTYTEEVFPVVSTPLTLRLDLHPEHYINGQVLRSLLNDAYTEITTHISTDGDSAIPFAHNPYRKSSKRIPWGAALVLESPAHSVGVGRALTWNQARDTVTGLKQYMRSRWYGVSFTIWQRRGGEVLGWGCVVPRDTTMDANTDVL